MTWSPRSSPALSPLPPSVTAVIVFIGEISIPKLSASPARSSFAVICCLPACSLPAAAGFDGSGSESPRLFDFGRLENSYGSELGCDSCATIGRYADSGGRSSVRASLRAARYAR